MQKVFSQIHSKFDACAVCLYKLSEAIKALRARVAEKILGSNFLITYSSRVSYVPEGKPRHSIGAFHKEIDAATLATVMSENQVIQTFISPYEIYGPA